MLESVIGHLRRLKSQAIMLLVCWVALIYYYPKEGEEVSKYWTEIYAIAKVTVGVIVSYITLHEVFRYVSTGKLLQQYNDAVGENKLPSAIVFAGAWIGQAILMGIIIYCLTIW